jgi:cell division septum initiation protein DivIVA
MDMTAQELRASDIRDSFRGYHRDDVDDLLERAAVTIEHLEREVWMLQHRRPAGNGTSSETGNGASPEQAASDSTPSPDDDLIGRTLLLAQKAADDAVAAAEARAQHLLNDSEAKADAMVRDAEETARRLADEEQRRAEAEIARLDVTRTALNADVEALERFASEYRDRIRRAFDDDFDRLLASPPVEEPPRPALQAEDASPSVAFSPASARVPEPAGRSAG